MTQKRFWTPPTLGTTPAHTDAAEHVPFWVADHDGDIPLIETPTDLTAPQLSASQAALIDAVDNPQDLPQNTQLGTLILETDYDITLKLKPEFAP